MFSNFTTYTTSYPSNRLNKATNFSTMFDTVLLPYNKYIMVVQVILLHNKQRNLYI